MKNIEQEQQEKLIGELMQMLMSGVNNLHNNYPQIDKLNVYPVPDGDTGTNMNLTAINGFNHIKDTKFSSANELLATFSHNLVLGARGNSGVIFSQIIKGFYRGLQNFNELSVPAWKKAFASATEIAYKSVMKPVEGTILTVIRETSERINELPDTMDIKEFWTSIVTFANESLQETPKKLDKLNGLVDSGGYGLVKFVEGVAEFVTTGKPTKYSENLETNEGGNVDMQIDNIEYGYCTEAVVNLNPNWIDKLKVAMIRDQLQVYGNTSIVVVEDEDVLKVHTHALNPGQVLMFLQQYGDFRTTKIENMNIQAQHQVKEKKVITEETWKETSTITNERKLKHEMATIAVVSSEELKEYYENELGVDLAINGGSKMNPSTNDFLEAIKEVDAKVVFIMPNNSNALLSARQAEKEEKKSKVYIIPTTTIQQGMASALNFDPSATPQKNNNYLTKAMKNVVSFSISKAAKDAIVDGIEIKNNQQMAIVDGKIVAAQPSLKIIFEKNLARYITNRTEILTIFVGQEANAKNVSDLRKFLDENFDVEYEIVEGGQKTYSFLISIE